MAARFQVPDGWVVQAFRYALDPTPGQVRAFWSHVGAARKAHNTMLDLVKAVIDQRLAERSYGIAEEDLTPPLGWSLAALRREWNRRKETVAPWWAENSKEAYNTGLDRLARALDAWSKSRTGERAGWWVGFPRFKSRRSRPSVRFTTAPIRVEPDQRHVVLPCLGRIKTHESAGKLARRVEAGTARILSATLSCDSAGRWHVSFHTLVQRHGEIPGHAGAWSVGVDVGVKADALLVVGTPDGRELSRVPAPRPLTAAQDRLRALQRKAARQQGPYDPSTKTKRRPSKRWQATQRRIGRVHARAVAIRRDVLHKATTLLAQRHEIITVETLNASGLRSKGGARKRGLNRALADAGLAEVRRMLVYKTMWYGSTLVEADRFFPSSKLCSGCGRRKPNLTLADRTFECEYCGMRIDRDLNAAINLARLGDTLHASRRTGGTGTGTGSRPAANQTGNGRVGDGRGATRKTKPVQAGKAAGHEASTPHQQLDQTGTAPPEGEAA